MEIIPESMPATAPAPQYLPRFADGTVNLQELIRSMAEMLACFSQQLNLGFHD